MHSFSDYVTTTYCQNGGYYILYVYATINVHTDTVYAMLVVVCNTTGKLTPERYSNMFVI